MLVTDLTPGEADKMLAMLDPSGDLARVDAQAQAELMADIEAKDAEQSALLDALKAEAELALDIEAQLAGETDPDSTERMNLGDRSKAVKVVVYMQDLEIVERAIRETGLMNRGEALTAICRYYLENEAGQFDIQTQGDAQA